MLSNGELGRPECEKSDECEIEEHDVECDSECEHEEDAESDRTFECESKSESDAIMGNDIQNEKLKVQQECNRCHK